MCKDASPSEAFCFCSDTRVKISLLVFLYLVWRSFLFLLTKSAMQHFLFIFYCLRPFLSPLGATFQMLCSLCGLKILISCFSVYSHHSSCPSSPPSPPPAPVSSITAHDSRWANMAFSSRFSFWEQKGSLIWTFHETLHGVSFCIALRMCWPSLRCYSFERGVCV